MEPAKQQIRERDSFVITPDLTDSEELSLATEGSVVKPPQLPAVKEINNFIRLTREIVEFPEVKKNQSSKDSGTISLDDMLEEPRLKNLEKFPELLASGLKLLPKIDPRFFETRSEFRAPFDILKEEADLARDLVLVLRNAAELVGRTYRTPFDDLMKKIMLSIDFHRGDIIQRRAEGIDVSSKLVVLEMCYDGGVAPRVEMPDIGMFRDLDKATSKRQAYGESEEGKTVERKKINYGRPADASNSSSLEGDDEASIVARRGEKTSTQRRDEMAKVASEEGRLFLHQSAAEDVRSFISRVRKPTTKGEQFGALAITAEEASVREDTASLKKFNNTLPSWVQHSIAVNEANIEKTQVKPYLQGVAEQLVRAACKLTTFLEICERNKARRASGQYDVPMHLSKEQILGWTLTSLNSAIKECGNWYKAYAFVIETMEAVAPIAERSGITSVLDENGKRTVKRLAPAVFTIPLEENPIFDKYLKSREEAALELKIELLARTIVTQNIEPGLLSFPEGSREQLEFAREIATKRLTKK